MPFASFEGSPCANTSASFDTEPLEIHIFRPRSTHEPPSRFALVRSFVASLPTSGSVRPKQPMTSPLHSAGSHRCFCSSVPNLRMVISTSEIWTESVVRTDESARPTSSVTSACETKSSPMPPYFSGTGPPSRPRGAILRSTSFGKTSLRSRSRAPGAISLSAKSFASLRIDCCSEVRSKSTRLLGRRALRGAFADREQRVDLADVPEAALEDAGRAAHGLRGRLVVRKRTETLRERANDRVEIPNQLRRVETRDSEHLLERVPGQRAKPVVAYTARVIAGPFGPTIGEPSLRRGLRPAEDAGEHVDPPSHMPDRFANVVPAVVGAPLEGVLLEIFEPLANASANALEPFRHEQSVAHDPSLGTIRTPDRHPPRRLGQGHEAVPRVEAMRVARREQDVAQTLQVRVRHHRIQELLRDTLSAMLGEHKDVAEPCERRPVGHHTREGDLRCAAIGVAGKR